MHLFDDITLKPKCSEADLFKGQDGLSTAQWAATLVICWFTFGTALHCFGSHCTVWHLLSAADLPLGSSSCQMPSRTLTSDIPEIQSLCHQDCPDACKGAAQIERSVPGSSCSSDHHRDCSFPLLPVSVHEPRRHIVGPSEQHVGVVPAWLGLVREPLCVVESFQRGVDVVVVPTRGVSCTKSSQFEGEGGSCASGMN